MRDTGTLKDRGDEVEEVNVGEEEVRDKGLMRELKVKGTLCSMSVRTITPESMTLVRRELIDVGPIKN